MFVAMLLLKQLQETELEKYGSFEDDQKICDFLKIYDSSKWFYVKYIHRHTNL